MVVLNTLHLTQFGRLSVAVFEAAIRVKPIHNKFVIENEKKENMEIKEIFT